jgi:hypothetical protein
MSLPLGDIRTLPASKQAKDHMKQLVTKDYFDEQRDVWTLGASLGLALGKVYEQGKRETFQNVNSLDPDGIFRAIMSGLYPDMDPKERATKLVDHAEWGIREISRREKTGTLNFYELCEFGLVSEKKEETSILADGTKLNIAELIRNGENEKVEFKSSLSYDYQKNNKSRDVELSVAKSVAAFLNSDGGYLFIGVKDNKTILGIEKDFSLLKKASKDAFELHFTNIVNKYIGAENRPCVTMRFAKIAGKTVSIVIVPKRGPREVYLTLEGQPFFYIRSGNSSQPLDVKQATTYIKEHWRTTLSNKNRE